jgi:hypothetical protein
VASAPVTGGADQWSKFVIRSFLGAPVPDSNHAERPGQDYGGITIVFIKAGRSDHRAREGQTVTLDGETPVTAQVKTGFCCKTLLSAIPAHS